MFIGLHCSLIGWCHAQHFIENVGGTVKTKLYTSLL